MIDRVSGVRVEREQLGGFAHRARPAFGMRPTLRFTLAAVATVAYVGLAVWVSRIWRGELEDAIGPVMGWVIPILMAYIPGIVIGFLCFTLIFTRYQPPPLRAPGGTLAERQLAGRDRDHRCVQRTGRDRVDARSRRRLHVPRSFEGCARGQQLGRPNRRAGAGRGGATRPRLPSQLRTGRGQAPCAQHGAGRRNDSDRRDRRRRYRAAPRGADVPDRARWRAGRRTSTCAPAPVP